MIAIVDNSLGNIGSIYNMLKKLGIKSKITSDKDEIATADKLILPGVGAFDKGIANLHQNDLWDVLNNQVLDKKTPVLGVCLGMQMMGSASEEGSQTGLGWVDATSIKFRFSEEDRKKFKVPHMGWNPLDIKQKEGLYSEWEGEARFYFVHSYHLVFNAEEKVTATAFHGYPVTASFAQDNIYGVQFHPEKSHKFGMRLLNNFARI